MPRPDDNRYVAEVPSGIVKKPKLRTAGEDLWVNDAVWLDGDQVKPMYDESHPLYGVAISRGMKGLSVLVAT